MLSAKLDSPSENPVIQLGSIELNNSEFISKAEPFRELVVPLVKEWLSRTIFRVNSLTYLLEKSEEAIILKLKDMDCNGRLTKAWGFGGLLSAHSKLE